MPVPLDSSWRASSNSQARHPGRLNRLRTTLEVNFPPRSTLALIALSPALTIGQRVIEDGRRQAVV
jgi:hypothetical protein